MEERRGKGQKDRKSEPVSVGLLLVSTWQSVLVPVGASDLRLSAGSGAGMAELSRHSTQGPAQSADLA